MPIVTTLMDLPNFSPPPPRQRRGMFVEVGAGPGVVKSHTVWLEARRSWWGLLVEPHDHFYRQLRRRRKAAAAHACVSDFAISKKVQ